MTKLLHIAIEIVWASVFMPTDLPGLQFECCIFICAQLIYLAYNRLHVFHFTLSTTGVEYIYMCSTLSYLQLEYKTFICVPLYLIYNWRIVLLHVFHLILSTTGVLYIYICTTLPYLQLENSTFTCVPLYIIYNWSMVHLHMFHLPYLQLEYSTFIRVHPIYLI